MLLSFVLISYFSYVSRSAKVSISCGHPGLPASSTLYLINSERIRFNDGETVRYVCATNFQTYTQTRTCVSGRWVGDTANCGVPIESDIELIKVYNCSNGSLNATNKEILNLRVNQSSIVAHHSNTEVILPPNSFHASRIKTGPIAVYGSACYLWQMKFKKPSMMPFISIDFGTELTGEDLLSSPDLLNSSSTETSLLDVSLFVSQYRVCRLLNREKQVNSDTTTNKTYLLSTLHFQCDSLSDSDYSQELNNTPNTIEVKVQVHRTRDLYLLAVFAWNYKIDQNTERPDCGKPETVQTGTNVRKSSLGISRFQYQCNESFTDITPNKPRNANANYWYSLDCKLNGEWEGLFPVCIPKIQCPGLGELERRKDASVVIDSIDNAYYVNGSNWVAGEWTQAQYSCANSDHLAIGKQVRDCLRNGSWSHHEPKCVAIGKPESDKNTSQSQWTTILILSITLIIFIMIATLIIRRYVSKVRTEIAKSHHRSRQQNSLYTDIRNSLSTNNIVYDDCQLPHTLTRKVINERAFLMKKNINQRANNVAEYVELNKLDKEPEYISIL